MAKITVPAIKAGIATVKASTYNTPKIRPNPRAARVEKIKITIPKHMLHLQLLPHPQPHSFSAQLFKKSVILNPSEFII